MDADGKKLTRGMVSGARVPDHRARAEKEARQEMPDVARNHHFIPEFLLAGFTPSGTKDEFLWVTDMKQRKGYSTKPCNVAFQKDFYRVDVEGVPPDFIETCFAKVEGIMAPVVKQLLEERHLPCRPQYDHLMELIGLLVLRVPSAHERANQAFDRSMKTMLQENTKDPDALRAEFEERQKAGVEGVDADSIDYEKMVRFAQNGELYTCSVDKEWIIGLMIEASVPMQRMLFERNWTVLAAGCDAGEFICSDAPVCQTWTDVRRQDRLPRPDEHGTDVTVPLGKYVALRGRYESDQALLVPCDRDAVAHINRRTISSADRFIYSSSKDFPWEREDGSIGDWESIIADLKALRKRAPRRPASGAE